MRRNDTVKQIANGNIKLHWVLIICGCVILLTIIWLSMPRLNGPHEQPLNVICKNRMKMLGLALQMYANDSDGNYPTATKWCDLIKPYLGTDAEKLLHCPRVKDANCTYAINLRLLIQFYYSKPKAAGTYLGEQKS